MDRQLLDQRLEKLKAEVKKPSYVWEVVQIADEFIKAIRTIDEVLDATNRAEKHLGSSPGRYAEERPDWER